MFPNVRSLIARGLAALGPAATRQAAALCWRRGADGVEILLITTRRTGRLTPPKGGLMAGESDSASAAIEAWEEAGAKGAVAETPIGTYHTMKFRKDDRWEKLAVAVFPLRVEGMEAEFPEKGQRESRWMAQEAAARAVREPALRRLIRDFTP